MDTVKVISDEKGKLHVIPNNLYRAMLGTGHIQMASNLKLLTKDNLPITDAEHLKLLFYQWPIFMLTLFDNLLMTGMYEKKIRQKQLLPQIPSCVYIKQYYIKIREMLRTSLCISQ